MCGRYNSEIRIALKLQNWRRIYILNAVVYSISESRSQFGIKSRAVRLFPLHLNLARNIGGGAHLQIFVKLAVR